MSNTIFLYTGITIHWYQPTEWKINVIKTMLSQISFPPTLSCLIVLFHNPRLVQFLLQDHWPKYAWQCYQVKASNTVILKKKATYMYFTSPQHPMKIKLQVWLQQTFKSIWMLLCVWYCLGHAHTSWDKTFSSAQQAFVKEEFWCSFSLNSQFLQCHPRIISPPDMFEDAWQKSE